MRLGRPRPPEPNLSMKSRSVIKLLRNVDQWYAQRSKEATLPAGEWQTSGNGNFSFTEEDPRTGNPLEWTITEIVSNRALLEEGRAMRHCVVSYARRCAKGDVSIWSLQVNRAGAPRHVMTIAVDNRKLVITQARGRFNAHHDHELASDALAPAEAGGRPKGRLNSHGSRLSGALLPRPALLGAAGGPGLRGESLGRANVQSCLIPTCSQLRLVGRAVTGVMVPRCPQMGNLRFRSSLLFLGKEAIMATLKTAEELHELVKKILLAAGADEDNADRVADHMILSNLSGVDTHGVNLLPSYVERIKEGDIVPDAYPEIVRETPTSALVKGNWTFGQTTAKYALDVAIAKAHENNMAAVGMVEANHLGRLGEYMEMATDEGMMAIMTASGFSQIEPIAVPYGGREPALHTNPWAMGFPAGQEAAMISDFATTASSHVKVINAQRRKETVPPDWIIDKDGNPSSDPNDFFAGGGLSPFGGHKGYALMMASEFLGRILTGSDRFADPDRGKHLFLHAGAVILVFKADLFRTFEEYGSSADDLERRVRSVPQHPASKKSSSRRHRKTKSSG